MRLGSSQWRSPTLKVKWMVRMHNPPHPDVSADMARRLEVWLGGPRQGPSAESWLKMQADYDLWQTMQRPPPKVVRARAASWPEQSARVSLSSRLSFVAACRKPILRWHPAPYRPILGP
jgi:hypothetical protein